MEFFPRVQETNLLVVTFHGFRGGEEGYKRCFPIVLAMPATQYKDFFFEMLNADKKGIVKLLSLLHVPHYAGDHENLAENLKTEQHIQL